MVLMQDDTDDLNAVRINIPLSRVETLEKTNMLSFAGLITVTFDPKSSNGVSSGPSAEKERRTSIMEGKEDLSLLGTTPDKQVLQIAVLRKDFDWENIMTSVSNAKTSASKDNVDWPGSRVHIDVDPRAGESAEKSDHNLSDLVKSVSFALGLDTTKEIWSTSCSFLLSLFSHVILVNKSHLHRSVVSYYGHLAVSTECVGFWSKSIAGGDVRYRVPLSSVKTLKPRGRGRARDYILAVEIQGQHDLRLGFSTEKKRDDAIEQINRFIGLSQDQNLVVSSPISSSPPPSTSPSDEPSTPRRAQVLDQIPESIASPVGASVQTNQSTGALLQRNPTSILAPLSRVPSTVQKQHLPHALKSIFPKAINVPDEVLLSLPSRHFVCLTIGSRGDVQPYIALGRGLQKEGHKVTIVTHEEYKEWITGFGVGHRTAGGDPGALMKLSVENKVSV